MVKVESSTSTSTWEVMGEERMTEPLPLDRRLELRFERERKL
jgi:hypothetical protein